MRPADWPAWVTPAAACAATGLVRQALLAGAAAGLDPRLDGAKLQFLASAALWTHALALAFNGPVVDRFGGRRALPLGGAGAAVTALCAALAWASAGPLKLYSVATLAAAVYGYFQALVLLSALQAAARAKSGRGVHAGACWAALDAGEVGGMVLGPWLASTAGPWGLAAGALLPAGAAWAAREAGVGGERTKPSASPLEALSERRAALGLASAAELLAGAARWGLLVSLGAFLYEALRLSPESRLTAWSAPLAGAAAAAGALAAGAASDYYDGSRARPAALALFASAFLLWALGRAETVAAALTLSLLAAALLFGAHAALAGPFAADLGGPRGTATASAILLLAQHASYSLAGPIVRGALERGGWGSWTSPLSGAALLAAFCAACLWWSGPEEN